MNRRQKRLRRLRLARAEVLPKKLREAHDFAELSKLAKFLHTTPSALERAGWRTSDK
jgi:hypothetical protein